MNTPLKLVAYNTSFANDAHWSQLHPGLSESAAIVAKAVEIYKNTNPSEENPDTFTFDELNNYFMDKTDGTNQFVPTFNEKDAYKNEEMKTQIKKSMQQKLGYVRMQLADAATSYLKSQMESSAFIALIEQMIHVPVNHQAYYGGPLVKTNLDVSPTGGYKYIVPFNGNVAVSIPPLDEKGFEGKNSYFGILRRIRQLKLYDIDGDGYAQNGNKTGDIIVYDNVVNVDSGTNGAAEGIAIIVNKNVCSGEQLFVWAKTTHPNKILGNSNGFSNDIGTEESQKFLHYYSDDFGKVIFNYRDESNPNRVRLVRQMDGGADLGRPIILTAGINNEILHIFVAIHSINIFNMAYLDDNFYGKYETLSEEKRNTVKTLTKIGNLKEDEESIKLKTEIYKIVHRQIGQFITDAFEKTSSEIEGKFTKVQLYLGGDFNDPEGEILKLLKTGLSFSIKGNVYNIKFSFNYDRNLLFSCCANRDSQTNKKLDTKKDKDQIDQTVGPLENAFNRVFGKNQIKLTPSSDPIGPIPYDPQDFYKFEKFGYNGDYALFGTPEPSPNFSIELDKSDLSFYKYASGKMVMASDHLPVYATVTVAAAGGGRRRRYSMRVLKRQTKKGILKKIRASRRKRRSHTYKNMK